MKKFNLFKMLAVLIVLITSINTAWGYEIFSQSGANAYFDNTNSNWNNSVWYFGIGKDKQNVTFWQMHDISNTKLKVVGLDTWNNANFFFVSNPNDPWGGTTYEHMSGNVPQTTGQYRAPVESDYTFTIGHYYLLVPSSGDHETSFSCTHKGSSGSGDIGYFSQTVNVELNGETPSTSPAAISITSYSWSAWDAVSENSVYAITKGGTTKTDTYSAAAYTAKTTLEVTDIASGYSFVGWYKDGYLDDEDEYPNKYIYYPRENNTIIARFENRYDVAVSAGAHGRITSGSASVSAGYYTTPTISAETYGANSDQYRFEKWVCTGGASVANANSATTTVSATSAGTVTAQFVSVWCVKGGEGSQDGVADALGDWDVCNSLDYTGTAYEYEGRFELVGGKTYDFQLWDFPNSKWYRYGKGNGYVLAFIGQTYASLALNVEGTENTENNLRVLTAGTGTYIFKWNSSTKTLKIEYPSVTHPSSDYVYFKDAASWSSNISAHVFTDSNNPKTGWYRIPLMSTCSFAGETYYYAALGGETSCVFTSGTDNPSTTTDDLTTASSNKGKYYNNSTNSWNTFDVTVTLDNQSATSAGTANVTATYNAAMPSIEANLPAKTGYDFQGYYGSTGGSGTKYYNADGTSAHAWDQTGASPTIYAKWTQTITLNRNGATTGSTELAATYNAALNTAGITNPSKDNYTFAGWATAANGTVVINPDKTINTVADWTNGDKKWIRNGASELVAKWTENTHVVTLNNDGNGHVEISSSTVTFVSGVGVETASSTITAVPNSGYRFKEWTGDINNGVTFASGDANTAAITINATADEKTITATFEEDTYSGTLKNPDGTENGSYSVTFNDNKITITSEPSKSGFHVGGYFRAYESYGLQELIVNADKTLYYNSEHTSTTYTTSGQWTYSSAPDLYIQWLPNTYTVTLERNDGTETETTHSIAMGANFTSFSPAITKPTRVGYDFAGFFVASSGGSPIITSEMAKVEGTYFDGSSNWIYAGNATFFAHWTAKEYTITLDDRGATTASSTSTTLKATYDSDALTASITAPRKWGSKFGGWEDGDGILVIDDGGNLVEDAGDYTDGDGVWEWDVDDALTLYAVWTVDESKTYTLTDGTTPTPFVKVADGIYRATRTMAKDNTVYLYDGTTAAGPTGDSNYEFEDPSESSSLGTNDNKFEYTGTSAQTVVCKLNLNNLTLSIGHVVFYLGDKEGDSHADVTDYDGYHADLASISGTFEYRLRVNSCTEWSTLYLPFSPTEVTVWGGTSNHHLFPYYYTNSQLYQGYYVLRTPTRTDLEIEKFDQWFDPSTYNALPAANTPYIVQWRNNYFSTHPYISIWGNGMTLPSFVTGTNPTTDDVVRVCGNGSLTSQDVVGAYVLESDYGGGAWLRGANPTDPVSVGPFQCYILASETTTANTLVIKRRTGEDSATDLEDIYNLDRKEVIVVYTISGLRVAQYNDCSFEEAGRRMKAELSEGIYIMNAGNESVKLIIR